MNKTSKKRHFYELDVLRFLAAMAVVFFHYTFSPTTIAPYPNEYPFLSEIFKYGYLGVDLFFIISGFVILLSTANKTAIDFSISRIIRLYPAFWIAVTLTALAMFLFGFNQSHDISWSQYLINMTMMPEYFGVKNIDSVYWTLQIELKFYFWIFVILLIKKIQHIEAFIFVWLIMALLETFHFYHEFTHQFLIPEWAPYFSAGALFFRIHKYGFTWARGLMLGLAYLLSLYYAIEGANLRTEIYPSSFSPIVVVLLTSLFYFVFALVISFQTTLFRKPWFIIMGIVTYPLYLIHANIGQLLFHYFSQSMNKYVLLVAVTLLMILISYLIYYYFERVFSKMMKRYIVAMQVSIQKIKRNLSKHLQ